MLMLIVIHNRFVVARIKEHLVSVNLVTKYNILKNKLQQITDSDPILTEHSSAVTKLGGPKPLSNYAKVTFQGVIVPAIGYTSQVIWIACF